MVKNKVSKGKGSSGRRAEKRKKRFTSDGGSGARANVLRDDTAPGRKRPREEGGAEAGAPRKTYKQGTFARPAPAPRREPPSEPSEPLNKKDLKRLAEARKATKKPNFTLIQARAGASARASCAARVAVVQPSRLRCCCAGVLRRALRACGAGADRDVGEVASAHDNGRGAREADGTCCAAAGAGAHATALA